MSLLPSPGIPVAATSDSKSLRLSDRVLASLSLNSTSSTSCSALKSSSIRLASRKVRPNTWVLLSCARRMISKKSLR